MRKILLLMALFCPLWLLAQNEGDYRTIKGVVMDSVTNETLIGATVVIDPDAPESKNLGPKGTITDIDGNFELKVPKAVNYVVISFIGYKPLKLDISKKTEFKVLLQPDQEQLEEVVVTGYQQIEKRKATSAIQTVKMDDIKRIGVASIDQLLEGQVAGMTSIPTNGAPGAPNKMRIRSTVSLTGSTDPLWVLDGMILEGNDIPANFSDKDNIDNLYNTSIAGVNPADIESITILKDAASTAVYGVRGGNGVILITTKPGIVSEPKFSVDYYEGFTRLTRIPDLVDGYEYMDAVNEAYNNTYGAPYYSQQYIENTKMANGLIPNTSNDRTVNKYLYPNVDWMKELYKNFGRNRRANLNVRGGAPNASYYISLSYYDESGLTKTDPKQPYSTEISYNRYNFLTNINLKATKKTTMDVGVNGWFSSGNYPAVDLNDIFSKAMMINPVIYPVEYPDGSNPGFSQYQREFDSPYVTLTRRGYKTEYKTQINSNLKVTQDLDFWDWSKGFTAHALIAFDVRANQQLNYKVDDSTWKPAGRKNGDVWVDDGNLFDEAGNLILQEEYKGNSTVNFERDKQVYRTFYAEAALNYKRLFGGVHNVSGLLLFNMRDYRDANGDNLINSLPYKQMSLSSRVTYSYNDRYFIEGNVGYTGSENFSPGHRFGVFPAMAVGWVPSNEKFWASVAPYISFLKFRYSHGLVGSDSLGDTRFGFETEITSKNGYSNSWAQGGIGINKYGYQARWCTILKQDLGIEINFLNNDLAFVFDLFKEHRDKIFVSRNNLPLYAGFAVSASGNVGIVENKGFEASFEYNHQFGKDWTVSLRGNFTMNEDEIIENAEPAPAYPWLEKRGTNVLARFGYIAEGLYESEEEIKERNITQFGETYPGQLVKPGDIKYKDLNGDGHIDEYDMCKIGRGDVPKYYYGFGGDFRYKNIGVGILFQGTAGADRVMEGSGIRPFTSSTGGGTLYANITDRWSKDDPSNDNVFYPRLAWSSADPSNINNFQTSTWWQKDMSFLRLKQFTVSYYFPKAWTKKSFLSGGRFYIMGSNVLTFSKFKLWDPELNTNNGISYPNVSSYTIGVAINL